MSASMSSLVNGSLVWKKTWLPSSEAFYQVEKIPVLGTGKLDLAAIKKMALELAAGKKQGGRESHKEAAATV